MMAPVILFVYNRPVHTDKALDALSKTKYAINTDLIIFSDGPRDNTAIEMVEKTRLILQNYVLKFNSCTIHKSNVNKGLGKSILDGINLVFQKYEKVIVLEDDLIVHMDFIAYMNFYLNLYNDNDNIFHISGFQKEAWTQFFLKRIYFTHFMNCSGWATWRSKWAKLILDNSQIEDYLSDNDNIEAFNYKKLKISEQLNLNKEKIKTWAFYWYATIMMNNGFCINPKYSLVKNIGDDGTGTNMGSTNFNSVINFEKKFKKVKFMDVKELKFSKYHICEAYFSNSNRRFKTFKKLLFNFFSWTYNVL
jgi:hypothetical protein